MVPRLSSLLLLLAFATVGTTPGLAVETPAAAPRPDDKVAPSERQPRTKTDLEQMRKQAARVEKLATLARSEKDIVRLNCVNEKLAQLRGLVRVSQLAEVDLRESDARREDEQAQHAFAKVQIAARRVAQLHQEAEQCVGQLAFYTDEKTKVDVETPPGLPLGDSTLSVAPGVVEGRPVPASGF